VSALVESAVAARAHAYCPYSGYAVGAAVLGPDGRVWAGCNVENVSFGLTLCAERAAVVKMVSDGVREVCGVAVATRDGGAPCGACLQVLSEFAPDPSSVRVRLVDESGSVTARTLAEYLPYGFRSDLGFGR
jgi:cytidine deaminase